MARTSARSNFSVIPARVSGAREESRIPLEDGGEGPGFFARQPRARMTEQEIEQDRNCHYDLQSKNSDPSPFSGRGRARLARAGEQLYLRTRRARCPQGPQALGSG